MLKACSLLITLVEILLFSRDVGLLYLINGLTSGHLSGQYLQVLARVVSNGVAVVM